MEPAPTHPTAHPIVFLVLAHADPVHLTRLLDRLGHRDQIVVNVDAKSPIEPFAHLAQRPNVELLEPRRVTNWGGFSLVEATLAMMERALELEPAAAHLVLLSGADYPLRPVEDLRALLAAHPDTEFLNLASVEDSVGHYRAKLRRRWWFDLPWPRHPALRRLVRGACNHTLGRLPRRLPDGPLWFGSQWWALTADCCRFVLDNRPANRDLERFHRATFAPDEHYIQTVVGNSPFAERAGRKDIVGESIAQLANLHVLHYSLHKWYDERDADRLLRSKLFFVRKVSTERSSALLDIIDQRLLDP